MPKPVDWKEDQFALQARQILSEALKDALPNQAAVIGSGAPGELTELEFELIDVLADMLCDRYRDQEE